MSWVFSEILIPLLIALLLGFLIGWLVFKWRRRTLHAHEWNQLTTNAQRAQADEAAVRAAYEESNNERKILADQAASLRAEVELARVEGEEQVTAVSQQLAERQGELAAEQGRRSELEADIAAAHAELEEHRAAMDQDSAALEEGRALSAEVERLTVALADAEHRAAELERSSAQTVDIERELDVLNAKIAEQDRTIAQHKLEIKDHDRVMSERDGEIERLGAELARTTGQISELESGATEAALVSSQVADADARSAELEAALVAARTELDVSQSRIADFDARLSTTRADLDAAHARVSDLEARAHDSRAAQNTDAAQSSDGGSTALIGQLRVDLAERDRRIAALEAAAATSTRSSDPTPPADIELDETVDAEIDISEASEGVVEVGVDESAAETFSGPAADVLDIAEPPMTAVGTAGAHHRDDLKVIHGIGPRMEELLNSLGITSWEQLADLEESEIAVVDDALEEFPGRIERDQWVDQARDLMARFPVIAERPTSRTFLNRSRHDDPQR